MLLLMLMLCAYAENATLAKILMIESSSYYKDGKIVWVDRRRGVDGERGCFQMIKTTWEEIKKPGEKFSWLDDPEYAETCAIRYLNKHKWRLRKWNASKEWMEKFRCLK